MVIVHSYVKLPEGNILASFFLERNPNLYDIEPIAMEAMAIELDDHGHGDVPSSNYQRVR